MSDAGNGEMPGTLNAIISASAARHPGRPAILAEDNWSFGRLSAEADTVARSLSRLGVRRGDRVALRLAPSGRALVLLAAIARAGGSAVPVDISTPPARLRALTADAGTRLTVDGEAQLLELFDRDHGHDQAAPRADAVRPDDEAYVIYTSGSTGTPKGVAVSHAAIAQHAGHAAEYFRLRPEDRILQFASLGFDVSQEEIWPSWAAGAAVVVNPVWLPDVHQLAAIAAEHEITVLQLPTAYWRTVVSDPHGPAAGSFSGVRLVVVGGEAARGSDVCAHAASALGHAELVNGYGPTETVVTSVAHRFPPGSPLPAGGTVPIGTAFPGREVAVVAPGGRLAGPGGEGELWVSGLLADGYVNRPDLTRAQFVTGDDAAPLTSSGRWYRTGDRAVVRQDGQLEFAGRMDDQVKLRGFRIELGEVDAALSESGLVRAAAAALIERGGAEPRLGALVVPHDRFAPEELTVALRDRLPAAFVPALWAQAQDIPLTASGKIDRNAVGHLIAAEAGTGAGAASWPTRPSGAATPMLDVLSDVWREVLGVAQADPDGDFFGLGGDSLLAVRFTARARAGGVVVKPADIVRKGTLSAIAASAQWQGQAAPGATTTAGRIALLPAQYRWLLDGPIADVHHFLVSALLRLRRDTPDQALLDVASALLAQHTALSSTFDLAKPEAGVADRSAADVVSVIDIPGPGALREAAQAVKSSLDPAAGDVFRIVRLRAGDVHYLMIVVHHLVLDGWSMALLVDEVEAALSRWLQTGRATLDQPSASVAAVCAAIDSYVASSQARRDARGWLDAPWSDLAPVRGRRPGPGLLPTVKTSRSAISSDDTATILRRLPTTAGRPVDLLRSAIFVAMSEWTGDRTWAIDVYDNHRAAPVGGIDVSRTIGYLQSTHPEIGVVRGDGTQALLRLLAAPRSAPSNLFSFDALRFLSPVSGERETLAGLPRPALRLNYRSQLSRLEQRGDGGPLADTDEDTGPDRARTQNERYDLMFEGDVIDNEFVVGAKFSTDHFHEAEVAALTRRIAELMSSATGERAS